MKPFCVNCSDINGGAARAAHRINHALREIGVDSWMLVNVAASGDWTVQGPSSQWGKAIGRVRPQLATPLRKLLRTGNPIIHSPGVVPSRWPERLNASDADVVHLHWVQGEMLSLADIGRICKPIVWTLHDMWAFCGAEHYTTDHRWRDGYRSNNRPSHESGFDLNRYTWQRKRKHWRRPLQIVSPSQWLADCLRASALMSDWPVAVVPNPIDTGRWQPIEQRLARQLLGVPQDCPLLLFGAMGGGNDPRKGIDLLLAALAQLRAEPTLQTLQLVVFGQCAPQSPPQLGFPVHYTGHLHDDLSLLALYSAADVFEAQVQLRAIAQQVAPLWDHFDVMLVPTAPTHYTIAQMQADPVALNRNLGTYTNFVNLLDYAALAVPSSLRADGLPFGVTFIGPCGSDWALAELGQRYHQATGLPLGATAEGLPAPEPLVALPLDPREPRVCVAVVGAHLSGMPLNGQLTERHARLVRVAHTAPDYRLYALPTTPLAKPGLVRVAAGTGAAIALEVWEMPLSHYGSFVALIPAPLGIGTIALADGVQIQGFVCEREAVRDAQDITHWGGWRAYTQARAAV